MWQKTDKDPDILLDDMYYELDHEKDDGWFPSDGSEKYGEIDETDADDGSDGPGEYGGPDKTEESDKSEESDKTEESDKSDEKDRPEELGETKVFDKPVTDNGSAGDEKSDEDDGTGESDKDDGSKESDEEQGSAKDDEIEEYEEDDDSDEDDEFDEVGGYEEYDDDVEAGGDVRYDEDDETGEDDEYDEDDESEEGSFGLNLFTILVMLIAAAITAAYFTCTVKTVHVTGNTLYTSKEIAEQVISDDTQLRHNSVFLTALYMSPWAPKIPFVEKVRVSMESPDTIMITVRDMDIAGYIPYAGKNLYFSADGVVLENSPLTIRNAAFVTGLTITKGDVGSRMEAENQGGLELVLNALEILKKYDLHTESIYLGKTGGVTMYIDQIKVQLGRTDFELKISKIAQIYPYLEGKSGTINLTNYSSSDENIILK